MLPVRVITPHSGVEAFRYALTSLWKGFPQAKWLAWRFFLRDTRAAHRQSLLGYFWLILPPLANTLVWVFLNSQKVIHIETGSVPYPVFVLAGTILWAAFNGALMAMLGVVNEARSVLSKVNFPHESLVYSGVLKAFVDSIIPAVLLIPALFLYPVPWSPAMLFFPVALVASLLLGTALGLIVIPVAALYSDISRAIQLGLRFGFFVTPVIFALPPDGIARTVMMLNPLTPLIVSGRTWLAGSGELMPLGFLIVLSASLVLIAAGLLFFKVTLPHIIERIGG